MCSDEAARIAATKGLKRETRATARDRFADTIPAVNSKTQGHMTRIIVRTSRARASHALQWAQLFLLFFGLTAGLTACASTAVAPLPEESRQFTPPPQYALWWKMAEACSGRQRDFNSVKWYRHADFVPTAPSTGDGAVQGEYFYGLNSVVITDNSINNPMVVRHEMLHALIDQKGHPAAEFRDSCGGLVTCFDACERAVGKIPVASVDAEVIDVTKLAVSQSVAPQNISMSMDGGYFALIVQVTNPLDHAVWVRLKPQPTDPKRAATFGYATVMGAQYDNVDGDLVSFGPGETKRVVYDLTVNDIPQQDGQRSVRAFYNATMLDKELLTITN
ncbi:MAG: hypothetical protein JWM95_3094 [Gemmatimonadetes bacterium]|nr:hypothetical protein [Gemmatimonadota bacterium]